MKQYAISAGIALAVVLGVAIARNKIGLAAKGLAAIGA